MAIYQRPLVRSRSTSSRAVQKGVVLEASKWKGSIAVSVSTISRGGRGGFGLWFVTLYDCDCVF